MNGCGDVFFFFLKVVTFGDEWERYYSLSAWDIVHSIAVYYG